MIEVGIKRLLIKIPKKELEMKRIRIIGLMLIIVIFLLTITPAQAHIISNYEESDQEYKTKNNPIVEKPGENVCCCPVVSPCVWALHCKCECRCLPY
jgi:hypothetical protein